MRFDPSAAGATAEVAHPGRLGALASWRLGCSQWDLLKTEPTDIKRRQCNGVKMSPYPTKQNVLVYKR